MRAGTAVALVVAVALTGCLDNFFFGEDGHVVLAEERLTFTPPDGVVKLAADFGSPCVPTRVEADAPKVTLDYWREAPVPDAAFVRTFNATSMSAVAPLLRDADKDAGGQFLHAFPDGAGTVDAAAPFDPERVLYQVDVADGFVTVENATLAPGEAHVVNASYEVATDRGPMRVTHEARVVNAGPGRIVAAQPPLLCAR